MTDFIVNFLSPMPREVAILILFLVFFIVGGIIGYVVGKKFAKHFNFEELPILTVVGFAILGAIISISFVSKLDTKQGLDIGIAKLKEIRVYELIFNHHPMAEKEFRDKVGKAIHGKSAKDTQAIAAMKYVAASVMMKYFDEYMLNAGDDQIYTYLQHSLQVQEGFQYRPDACAKYIFGEDQNPLSPYVKQELELKAKIVESAIKSPTTFKKISDEEIFAMLEIAYKKIGAPTSNIAKLDYIQTLNDKEICNVSADLNSALVFGMPKKQAVLVYKNFISPGN